MAILMVADIFMDGGVPGAGPRQEEELQLQQQAWLQASKVVRVVWDIAVEKQLTIEA